MNKICRICLEEGVLSSVFTKNYNIFLCDMIEYCCNVKISKDDGLPEQICSNCICKLGIAYHFKQTCESADIRLRQYLGLRIPSKYNDACVATDPVVPTYTTIIKKCKCKMVEQKRNTNYKRKPEAEKLKRGPKPKPKPIHSCYHCDKQFRCQAQLEMHVRTHTGDKPFACMYCPRRFTQKHNLAIHVRIHTGEKPFQCEICSKTFTAQGNLNAHLKIHTGQRDHVCTLCKKSFITSSELTRHMGKHRGIRNFKCDLCTTAYVYARDLKLHKLKKHPIANQNPKMQNDCFNNSGNIDIIGIDAGKDPPEIKDVGHLMSHLINEKPLPNLPAIPETNQSLITYENKSAKEMFQLYPSRVFGTHNCELCREGFEYVSELAQHYMQRHKSHENAICKSFLLPQ